MKAIYVRRFSTGDFMLAFTTVKLKICNLLFLLPD